MNLQTYKPADTKAVQKASELIQKKQFPAALDIYVKICKKNLNHPEAWLMRGNLHGWLKDYQEAAYCFRHVTTIAPRHPQAHFNLGIALQMQGKQRDAIKPFKTFLSLNPGSVQAEFHLGLALQETGDLAAAKDIFTRLIQANPESADLHGTLAGVSCANGDYAGALQHCSQALRLRPDFADAHCQKARILQALGKPEDALDAYKNALELNPELAVANKEISQLYLTLNNYDGAAANLEKALRIDGHDAGSWIRLGDIYRIKAQQPEAIRCYKKAIEIKEHQPMAHCGLAQCYETLGILDRATSSYETALHFDRDNEKATAGLAGLLMVEGRYDEALHLLSPIINHNAELAVSVKIYSEICRHNGDYQAALDVLKDFLDRRPKETGNLHLIHYQLGALLDKQAKYDEAFLHFQKANALGTRCHSVRKQLRFIDKIEDIFSKHDMPTLPRSGIDSQLPVFIVGMPRSGTTLVEQIIDSHPLMRGAGERTDIWYIFGRLVANNENHSIDKHKLVHLAEQYLSTLNDLSDGALRVTDKLPHNFLFIGLIELLFPKARIIHCERNAADTCLSIYFHDMETSHAYATDLNDLGTYYCKYLHIMEHWKKISRLPTLNVRYEDLISDQERVSKRIIEFCGPKWDEQCLAFHNNRRPVGTHSHGEVRKPIYSQSIQRWRHYEKHIGELLEALGKAAD